MGIIEFVLESYGEYKKYKVFRLIKCVWLVVNKYWLLVSR